MSVFDKLSMDRRGGLYGKNRFFSRYISADLQPDNNIC